MTCPKVIKVKTPGPPGPSLQLTGPAVAGRISGTGNLVSIPLGPGLSIVDGALVSDAVASSGTVRSVALSVPTGFDVSNSPITTSGTLQITFATGYSLPSDAKQAEWDAKATAAQGAKADTAIQPGDLVSTSAAGLAPATGTPSGKYLKDDGTWSEVTSGATPAGSGTEVQFRNSNALGAIPNSSVDGATGAVTLARLIVAANGAASTPPVALTGTWFTGGTSTTTKPALLIEPAGTASSNFNAAGTGFGVNAPPGFTGDLAWFGVNGTSQARILSNGALRWNTTDSPDFLPVAGGLLWRLFNGAAAMFGFYNNYLLLNSGMALSWNSIGDAGNPAQRDLILFRDTAGTLAQRNGTNPQTQRIYNTFTNTTNFERAKVEWVSNILRIGTEKGVDGGTARDMELQTDGTTRITVKGDGAILFSGIPTTDPNVAGQLWNDGGTLKISAG